MAQRIEGRVGRGFQFASGGAVGRATEASPFSDATLRLQYPHFLRQGVDLVQLVPGLVWGTVNIELDRQLMLVDADHRLMVDWTANEPRAEARIGPELFLLLACELTHRNRHYAGLIYYPHPSTKPPLNAHRYDVIEVIAPPVTGLGHGDPIVVTCREGAFAPREI